MFDNGAIGCLHRFMSIANNVKEYKASPKDTWCSIGIGPYEVERAAALFAAGCTTLVLDVAHGAALHVVEATKTLQGLVKDNARIIVGNFATGKSINDFIEYLGNKNISAFKVGIGGGCFGGWYTNFNVYWNI